MSLCDVVFPRNIPPLTYRVPEELKDRIRPGQTVIAPLKGTLQRALLWRLYEAEPLRKLEYIVSVDEDIPFLEGSLLKLIHWTAHYYLCSEGQVLRVAQFEHYGSYPKRSRPPRLKNSGPSSLPLTIPIRPPRQGVLLYRSSSLEEEMAIALRMVFETIKDKDNSVLILCPERHEAEGLFSLLKAVLPEKEVGLYHGMLTDAQKRKVIGDILEGRTRVIVGTKSGVFLPLRHLGLIILVKEHSRGYKQEEVPKLNARDIAIKRAEIEQIPIVLTSSTPSAEAFLNAMLKRYAYRKTGLPLWRVPVRLIKKRTRRTISASVFSEIKDFLNQGGAVLVVEHRLGYGLLQCKECQHLLRCPECKRPMTYHRYTPKGAILSCHFCALSRRPPEVCPVCGGFGLETVGHGLESVKEELERAFGEVSVLKDEDAVLKTSSLSLGTLRSYRIKTTTKVLLVILNPDLFINLPELRPAERLFQELYYIVSQLGKGSRVLLQTTQPNESFYRFLRRWDYLGFIKNEIYLRRTLGLPPFKKVVSLMVHLRTDRDIKTASHYTEKHLSGLSFQGPLVLGSPHRGYKKMIKYLFYSPNKTGLKDRLQNLEEDLSTLKALLRVDVDPYEF